MNIHDQMALDPIQICRYCPITFTEEALKLIHEQRIHGAGFFHCSKCFLTFDLQNDLDKHNIDVHEPKLVCELCGLMITAGKIYQQHIKNHSLSCPYLGCGRTLCSVSAFKYHIEVFHKQPTSHKCELCNAEFNHKNKVLRHMERQHGEKLPCPFPVCNYSTSHRGNLVLHCKKTHKNVDLKLRIEMLEKLKIRKPKSIVQE